MVVLFCDGTVLNIDSKEIDYFGGDYLEIGDEKIEFQELEKIFTDLSAFADYLTENLVYFQDELLKLKDRKAEEWQIEEAQSSVNWFNSLYEEYTLMAKAPNA